MSRKIICRMLVFLICGILFLGTASPVAAVPTATKMQLLQAVENAKKENRQELSGIIRAIRTKKMNVSDESLPDFVAFLKEKDPQIQLLGAEGLYRLRNAKSLPALTEYLKSRDIVGLKKAFDTGQVSNQEGKWIAEGFSAAILALGEIGDKSVIPLLESMKGATNLQFEFGGGPVEKALSQLGAEGVRSLSRIKSDARYDVKVMKAEKAIREIRDPDKVPALIATVNDPNCNVQIRMAAVQALGEIKEVDSFPFLLLILKQQKNPPYLRIEAALSAAKSGQPQVVEQAVLEILKEPQNNNFAQFVGVLVSINAEKHLPLLIDNMLDKSLPLKQRKEMASILYNWSISKEQIKRDSEQIKKGLQAVDADGQPVDDIRFDVWQVLNKATGEEPPLEVKDRKRIGSLLNEYFDRKLGFENVHASAEEIRLMVEQKLDSIIVQWHPKNEEAKP